VRLQFLKRARAKPGVLCFTMVYNEEWFLPRFLDHYRALGISHFAFYDDGSTDSTRELLMAQDDCTVITAADPETPHGVAVQTDLINGVPEMLSQGSWSISVDADEFLLLPTLFKSIDEVVVYLEKRKEECALAPMIDFYPDKLADRFFGEKSLFEGCPWFDVDSPLQRVPDKPQPRMIPAGVRVRLLTKIMRRHPELVEAIYGEEVYRYAKLWKVPLLKTGSDTFRIGPHNVDTRPPEFIQLALAHFKFYPELDRRIEESLARNVHYLGAVEYRFLKMCLELFADESLLFRRSKYYRSPQDLEDAKLMWAE
jgi:Glycosyl transferase family 2